MAAIESRQATIFDFKFAGTSAAENLPICGGNMRILIEPLTDRLRDAYHAVVEAIKDRSRAVFVRHVLTDEKRGKVGIITHFHRGQLPPGDNRETVAI